MSEKKTILIFIGHYLPGTKSGGILRSVENMINLLGKNYKFKIITRNKDINSSKSYENISSGEWTKVGNAEVLYMNENDSNFNNLVKIINNIKHDFFFINSFFDKLSIKIIFGSRIGRLDSVKNIIISPRGEFAWASFKLRLFRKFFYVIFSRIFGFYSKLIWHVSSKYEMRDLVRIMNIKKDNIKIAMDLPKIDLEREFLNENENFSEKKLKIIFLSRISEEKNLDIAIRMLSRVKSNIVFDIYGDVDSKSYWRRCQDLLNKLPDNIEYNYYGFVKNDEVLNIFSKYDLFLFPTGGENYGHVIAESISVGTKVLISKNTPWLELENDNIGWDLSLDNEDNFINTIENEARTSLTERIKHRKIARQMFSKRFKNSNSLSDNINLFSN
jgi:glycosyltransferase involved in cell wall biosynthesis